ncbi:FliA/WhiG family RNA polymerase sigma factor [Clostridium sp.]|uniref:sigma-70 family RNA polymerase sigma factor n=1 Tax=Clostridium sp. TaxID=1506 RepID=UPI001B5A37FF|nr:FliA/WhiG family RNA polymerase sigma factor [Clostridium sp.]MBP3917398.1 FliA/WhiG family RNA polymerase sigma factor [Clostridium sp.]
MEQSISKLNQENLVRQYTPLVKYVASRILLDKNRYYDFEDLVGYGYIGLINAIKNYNPNKGSKFSTFATIKIRGAIYDELRSSKILSRTKNEQIAEYYSAIEELEQRINREPTQAEIADEMGCTIDDVYSIQNNINVMSMLSLDNVLYNEDFTEENKVKVLNGNDVQNQDEIMVNKELADILTRGIDLLKEKERIVLNLYYYEELTLKEIGKILGISESRVCQIHSKAIVGLKKYLCNIGYNA